MAHIRKARPVYYRVAERSPQAVSKPRNRKTKFIVIFVLVAAIAIVIRIVSAPVTGHNTKVDVSLSKKKSPSTHQVDTSPSTVANSYYKLDLPVGYHVQANGQTPEGILSNQIVTKPGALGSLIINIAVKTLPEGGIDNDSSYRLRTQRTDQYSMESQTYAGQVVKVSNDKQSAAVAAFWVHGGYMATIGISSSLDNPGADDNADELSALKVVLSSWQWQ